jgi:hypothetical protein
MSPPDPLVFLQTLLTKEFGTHPHPPSEADHAKARAPLVITLSRDHGSLGEEIAQRLSQCLGIVVYDQEILNRVAKRAKTDKFHFKGHDEQTSAALTSFLHSLVSGKSGTLQDYRRHLGEVVAEIARTDGIIIGRGAHLILGARKALRIRVVGSRLICAQRIASTCHIPVPEAEQQVVEINKKVCVRPSHLAALRRPKDACVRVTSSRTHGQFGNRVAKQADTAAACAGIQGAGCAGMPAAGRVYRGRRIGQWAEREHGSQVGDRSRGKTVPGADVRPGRARAHRRHANAERATVLPAVGVSRTCGADARR